MEAPTAMPFLVKAGEKTVRAPELPLLPAATITKVSRLSCMILSICTSRKV